MTQHPTKIIHTRPQILGHLFLELKSFRAFSGVCWKCDYLCGSKCFLAKTIPNLLVSNIRQLGGTSNTEFQKTRQQKFNQKWQIKRLKGEQPSSKTFQVEIHNSLCRRKHSYKIPLLTSHSLSGVGLFTHHATVTFIFHWNLHRCHHLLKWAWLPFKKGRVLEVG